MWVPVLADRGSFVMVASNCFGMIRTRAIQSDVVGTWQAL
jgi:hypothetical protein